MGLKSLVWKLIEDFWILFLQISVDRPVFAIIYLIEICAIPVNYFEHITMPQEESDTPQSA